MTEHIDNKGTRMGMWFFLYTEIMLFGGLFVLYAAYYHRYTQDFITVGRDTMLVLGTMNTAILLVSSFAVAAAIRAMSKNSSRVTVALLIITIVLGWVFLLNKYIEWSHDFARGYYPGSDKMMNGPRGQSIFFALYFTLTGLHALHVFIGTAVLSACGILVLKKRITSERMNFLENTGLFWHLVDIIWIFLFPLFYLLL
jgi:cytochrome c oxidase subunit 3